MIVYPRLVLAACVCGGQPFTENFLGSSRWWVKCPNCKVHGEGPSEEAVINQWNRIMRQIRWQNSTVKGCCRDLKNLIAYPVLETDREVMICTVCKCRHVRMLAEPGSMTGKLMGV